MRYILIILIVIILFGCLQTSVYKPQEIEYKKMNTNVFGYGFSKSMNEELAMDMARANARKNIAEQIAGVSFTYTNLNNQSDLKMKVGPVSFEGITQKEKVILESSGITICVLKLNDDIRRPIGPGVITQNMTVKFSDDLLKVSKSRSNIIKATLKDQFPRAHEVRGTFYVDDMNVEWSQRTGVIDYKESYLIVIESVQ